MDKNFYFFIDDRSMQHGPVRADYFKHHGIKGSTLVWFDGLPNWVEAQEVPSLTKFIDQTGVESLEQPAHYHEYIKSQISSNAKRLPSHVDVPKSWVVESILLAIFCSIIPGIVGLIYGSKVNYLWNNKEYAKAIRYSNIAGNWVKWGFTISVVLIAAYLLISLLAPEAYYSVIRFNHYIQN
ncbi:MAG: CD225/dispanin family protein [Rikenellaceae bacterium]